MSEHVRPRIQSVGIVYRARSAEAADLACALVEQVRVGGRRAWSVEREDEAHIGTLLPTTDVVLVLGGDGTILSMARLCAPLSIPILGINFGRVGELAEPDPCEVYEKLPLYLTGNTRIDERSIMPE